jgi:hypothetical protein
MTQPHEQGIQQADERHLTPDSRMALFTRLVHSVVFDQLYPEQASKPKNDSQAVESVVNPAILTSLAHRFHFNVVGTSDDLFYKPEFTTRVTELVTAKVNQLLTDPDEILRTMSEAFPDDDVVKKLVGLPDPDSSARTVSELRQASMSLGNVTVGINIPNTGSEQKPLLDVLRVQTATVAAELLVHGI